MQKPTPPTVGSTENTTKRPHQPGVTEKPAPQPFSSGAQRAITGSMLYSLVSCPHRVTMDVYADPAQRDSVNAFVEMLLERGSSVERERMAALDVPFVDLQAFTTAEKTRKTRAAMAADAPLIYGGRIEADDLLGEPDLLRKEGGGYVPGDIKSVAGEEGGEDSRPKKTYAVQLALYMDILERLNLSAGRRGFIWDVHGAEVIYDMTAPRGVRSTETWWDFYTTQLTTARGIMARTHETLPAYASGTCKLCHWYSSCLKAVKAADDLTLISELGRAKRDAMCGEIRTVAELATINPKAYTKGNKTAFAGIGPVTLGKFHERAKLLSSPNPKPYLKTPLTLPAHDFELFFDIEVDPMRDLCYLHGFIERRGRDNSTEKFIGYFTPDTRSSAKTSEALTKGVPVLRMGNIFEGQLDYTNLKYLPACHDEFPELLLRDGDILFNRTNSAELVGKTAVYSDVGHPISFASYLIRLRVVGYLPELLSAYINSAFGRAWVRSVVKQQVGQANVNGTKLRELGVPMMPMDEQKELWSRINRAFTIIERLSKEATRATELLDRLDQATLGKAFRGDLMTEAENLKSGRSYVAR